MANAQNRVRDAMTPYPSTIGPDSPIIEAARIMRADRVGSLPVVQDERLVGMLTDRDIVMRVVAEEKDPMSTPAGGIASRELVTIQPDDSLDDALRLMARHQVRRLPVVEDGLRLIGIVAQADVARGATLQQTGKVVQRISDAP